MAEISDLNPNATVFVPGQVVSAAVAVFLDAKAIEVPAPIVEQDITPAVVEVPQVKVAATEAAPVKAAPDRKRSTSPPRGPPPSRAQLSVRAQPSVVLTSQDALAGPSTSINADTTVAEAVPAIDPIVTAAAVIVNAKPVIKSPKPKKDKQQVDASTLVAATVQATSVTPVATVQEGASVCASSAAASLKEVARQLYASGERGKALVASIAAIASKPSAAEFCSVLLNSGDACINDHSWLAASVYGEALASLLGTSGTPAQIDLLYEVQKYCNANQFPNVAGAKCETALIDVLFRKLYIGNIIEDDTFIAWSDDVSTIADRKQGRGIALKQTSNFVIELLKANFDSDDEGA